MKLNETTVAELNVVATFKKIGYDELKLIAVLKQSISRVTNIPSHASIYFDGGDLVYGSKTIVPNALTNRKLKMIDLLRPLYDAIVNDTSQSDDTSLNTEINPDELVSEFYKRTGDQMAITQWIKEQTGVGGDELPIYFDGADLVWGSKTIVPGALTSDKLKFSHVKLLIDKIISNLETERDRSRLHESTELSRIKELVTHLNG